MDKIVYDVWLKRAESNLNLAKVKLPKGTCYEDLAFQTQQAAEKSLKALFSIF